MFEAAVFWLKDKKSVLIPVVSSILIIFFLFYIDEGYYSTYWMRQPGNWIAFGFYLLAFSLGQFIASQVFLKRYKGNHRITLTNLIGIPLGFGLILSIFYFATL